MPKAWDLVLPHVEFAYNKPPSKTIGMSHLASSPLDLVPRATGEKPTMQASMRAKKI